MKTTRILFFTLLPFVFMACCKPAEPLLSVKILNANGDNILVNAASTDSTWALIDNPTMTSGHEQSVISSADDSRLNLRTWSLNSGQDHYLMVDPSDVDTFNVIFEVKGKCKQKVKIQEMTYNGNKFEGHDSGTITVTKY